MTTVDAAQDRRSRRMSRLAWVVCGVTLAVVATRLVLAIIDPASSDASSGPHVPGGGVPVAAFEVAALVAIAVIGAVVTSRQPRNPVGWIFSAISFFLGVLILSAHTYWSLALGESEPSGTATVVAWLGTWIWIPAMLFALTLLPLYFPTGRPPTPGWRWVQWVVVAAAPALFLGTAFVPGEFEDYPVENRFAPDGVLGTALTVIGWVGFAMMLIAMLASVTSLIIRFRRSRNEERQQIKWVATAAVLFAVIFVTPSENLVGDDVGFATLLLGLMVIAIAVAVSILKYRLYDIDVVISRSLLVAGLAGFITAAYVGIVVGVGSLLGGGGDDPNVVLSVVATTVVAVAFQPVRRRLQRVANRLVFGRRSTPYDVLSGFATRVGAAESSPQSLVHLAELLAEGTGADPARVWLRVGAQLRVEASWPVAAGFSASVDIDGDGVFTGLPEADLAVPVTEHGELLGVLTIAKPRGERVSEVDVDLVERLAAACGVVLRNLRLDAELTQRLADLEASRRRLVSAQDDARRRIEADLAGGSRAELDLLRERLTQLAADVDPQAAQKTAVLLGQLVDATDGALETLAGLAAGVYPPRLAADGLVVALTEQVAKAALPVEVAAERVGRYASEVEAAIYFAVLEALQNTAKYAKATSAQVCVTHHGETLSFEVTDDGAGFDTDTTTLGTGLQGIVDRLDTVNGSVTITSHPGSGTTVAGSVPAADHPEHDAAAPALTGALR